MESSDAILARLLALHPKTIDLSLGRIERLLERLGHPEKRLPPTIHVAGTNGKGSTIAFMRAILEAAGLAVHVYTSPHLVRFHERIRIGRPGGGSFVPEDQLVGVLRDCEAANEGAPITVFEITTAAALKIFADEPADVLLLEVGLGGRLDATNVIDEPAAALVTPIGLDHAEYLGDTVEKIAAEKAGIFKRGAPAVIARQDYAGAERVLVDTAERVGASLVRLGGQDFSTHEENGRLVFQDEDGLLDLPMPRLPGGHQLINAGLAIAGLRAAGFSRLPAEAFERGMVEAEWPGRLQRLTRGVLPALAPEGAEVWVDGGHNPDGGRVVAAAMADRSERADAPLVLIVGMLGTKDAQGFLKNFAGLAKEAICVPIPSQMAARPPEEVAALAASVGLVASTAPSVEAALALLNDTVWEAPPRVLICGSLYLAGAVLAANGSLPT
jgi:dihydrofolate synthase/folylpolyglutamate synthase